MNNRSIRGAFLGMISAGFVAGCGAAPADEPTDSTGSQVDDLTLLDCTAELNTCIGNATTIAELSDCNTAYGVCLLGGVETLPEEVVATADAVLACEEAALTCVEGASSPSELLACQTDNLTCTADALGVSLDSIPASSVTGCPEEAAACVESATTVSDLVACGEGLTQCVADSAGELVDALPLPPELTDAVDAVGQCLDDVRVCVASAQTASDLVACQEAEAACLAGALGVSVPDPTGAIDCAEASVSCVMDAQSLSDLVVCTNELADCTGGVIGDVVEALPLPEEVETAVDETIVCADDLRTCVGAAQTPEELVACNEASAACLAGVLNVELPTLSDVAACVETATSCVLAADSLSALTVCAEDLAVCAADQLPTTDVPVIDCSAQFTQCLAANPFALFQCAEEARQCELANP